MNPRSCSQLDSEPPWLGQLAGSKGERTWTFTQSWDRLLSEAHCYRCEKMRHNATLESSHAQLIPLTRAIARFKRGRYSNKSSHTACAAQPTDEDIYPPKLARLISSFRMVFRCQSISSFGLTYLHTRFRIRCFVTNSFFFWLKSWRLFLRFVFLQSCLELVMNLRSRMIELMRIR